MGLRDGTRRGAARPLHGSEVPAQSQNMVHEPRPSGQLRPLHDATMLRLKVQRTSFRKGRGSPEQARRRDGLVHRRRPVAR